MIKWQITGYNATWRQAAQSRAMSQALWDNIELRTAVECQQSFQLLISLYYPEPNIQHDFSKHKTNINTADMHPVFLRSSEVLSKETQLTANCLISKIKKNNRKIESDQKAQ